MRIHLLDSGERPTVLLATSDGALGAALGRAVAALGFTAVNAATRDEAETCRRTARTDVSIIDAGLRGDGVTLVESLRATGENHPVLLLQSLTADTRRTGGADAVLTKPFSLPELHATLDSLLPATAPARRPGPPRRGFHLLLVLIPILLGLGLAATAWLLTP